MTMFRIILILPFLSFSIASQILLLYPDADLSNSSKLNASDVKAVHFLLEEGLNQYSDSKIISPSDESLCYSKECALSLADEYNASQVVTSKIRVLGTKIIFTGMILDSNGENEFNSRITAINVEDMENATLRLTKSLLTRTTINLSADVDNITFKESLPDNRRATIHRVGGYIGYLVPFGGNGYYALNEEYIDEFNGYNDEYNYSKEWQSTILQFGFTNYWELRNNSAIFLDSFINALSGVGPSFGIDLSFNKFSNKSDYSTFYGGGLGWYLNPVIDFFPDSGSEDEVDSRASHGLAFIGQVGYVFMRTYDFNIFARMKYHFLFQTVDSEYDNGITFNVTVVRKMRSEKRKNPLTIFGLIFGK